MGYKFEKIMGTAAIMLLIFAMPVNVWAQQSGTVEVRVSANSDDAEQNNSNGAMSTGGTDLEMVLDGGIDQTIGIRFQNITIPPGSTITNAYIQFRARYSDNAATNLIIRGEAVNNPPTFALSGYEITNRMAGSTAASVPWNPPRWWANTSYQTSDITDIVQELVDMPGWSNGNPMVFFIDGAGSRRAYSLDYSSWRAPRLHIEYTSTVIDVCISDDDDDAEQESDGNMNRGSYDLDLGSNQEVGVRFRNVGVPPGAVITSAYIEFEADDTTSSAADFRIYGEAASDAAIFSWVDENITDRNWTNQYIEWNSVETWYNGSNHQTPDLSVVVQEIIGTGGWANGNAMVFIIEGTGYRTAESHDGDSSSAACLHIEYSNDPIPVISTSVNQLGAVCYVGNSPNSTDFTITNTGSAAMNAYTISPDVAWLSVSPSSGDLAAGVSETITVTYDTVALGMGTHDATISITHASALNSPKNISVSVTINQLPAGMTCGQVPVYTENLVSPAILILLDVSGSMDNMMDVSIGQPNPQTPDLSTIVQELVNRDDWADGNAMVFIFAGTGHRAAKSYDESSGSAPLLRVTYNTSETVEVRVSGSYDDAEEESDGDMRRTSGDLDLGSQRVGVRFASVAIPQGAIINSASIEFEVAESQSVDTDQVIYGEGLGNPPAFAWTDNDITNRVATSAYVLWDDEEAWEGMTQMSRIDIGTDVISELVQDRSISWGFGTWTDRSSTGYTSAIDYTKVHVGCEFHDDPHQDDLQASIAACSTHYKTPLTPSLNAGRKYFEGLKADDDGDTYVAIDCQPMFVITVTDGLGNTDTDVANVITATDSLCDNSISPVVVGFGIDDATQIQELARVANERGHSSTTDSLYALHNEVAAVGQPFLANNRDELLASLKTITESVKANIFHGSSPAPTTSSDLGDSVLIAKFDASDWTGDLVAITKTVGTLKVDDITGTFQDDELLISLGGEARVDGTLSGNYLDYDGKESSFSVGQEVTGGSSGATGTIDYISISGLYTGTLELSNITGAFTDDEIITSVAGSATEDGILRRNLLKYGTKTADFVVGEVITGQTSGTIGTIDSIDIINSGYGTLQLTNVYETYDLRYDAKTVDFSVGEVVTGDTSSATGTVFSIRVTGATTGTLRLSSVSGTFDDNEALSGDSGGTATAYGRPSDEILFEEDEDLTGDSGGAARANSELYNALSYDALTSEFNVNETVVGGTSGAEAVIVEVVEAWELDNYAWAASDEMPDAALKKVFTVTDPADPGSLVQYTDALLPDDNFLCKPLGDIINSTPIVVGSPPYWYDFDNYDVWKRGIERDPVVYIGANDGFLHALSLNQVVESGITVYEPGEEKWAFLPNNLQAKLDSASDPTYDMCDSNNYCHQYFVDGSPKVADIYNGTDWKTLLVCGEGEGGEAYFGLDVTSGNSFDDAADPSVFLWEFTDSDLGQTLGEPAIARVYDITLGCSTWGVFFGSGYSSTDQDNKTACLYGIQAHSETDLWYDWGTGTSYNKIELTFYSLSYDAKTADFSVGEHVTGVTSGAIAMIVSIDADISSGTLELENVVGSFQDNEALIGSLGGAATVDGTLGDALLNNALASPATLDFDSTDFSDHIYVGDLYGTMYRVSNIGKGYTPWVSKLFRFDAFPSSPNIHPIRAKATFAYTDVPGYVWVYFGTGRYETQADKTSMNQQYLFGIKEDHGAMTNVYNETSGSGLETLEARYVTDPITGRQLRYIYGPNPLRQSWALKLDRGDFPNSPTLVGSERVIEQALVAGGILFFATFIPDQDVCAGNGDTWLFALDYKSGLAPSNPVFDINGDSKIDKHDVVPQDMNGDGVIEDGEGIHIAAIPIGSGQGSKPVLFGDTLFITTTGGGLTTLPVNLPETRAQLRFWRHNN